jgi:hypothetical protein
VRHQVETNELFLSRVAPNGVNEFLLGTVYSRLLDSVLPKAISSSQFVHVGFEVIETLTDVPSIGRGSDQPTVHGNDLGTHRHNASKLQEKPFAALLPPVQTYLSGECCIMWGFVES